MNKFIIFLYLKKKTKEEKEEMILCNKEDGDEIIKDIKWGV